MIDAARYISGEITDEEERNRIVRVSRNLIQRVVDNPMNPSADDINNVHNANAVMAYYAVIEAGIGNPG